MIKVSHSQFEQFESLHLVSGIYTSLVNLLTNEKLGLRNSHLLDISAAMVPEDLHFYGLDRNIRETKEHSHKACLSNFNEILSTVNMVKRLPKTKESSLSIFGQYRENLVNHKC